MGMGYTRCYLVLNISDTQYNVTCFLKPNHILTSQTILKTFHFWTPNSKFTINIYILTVFDINVTLFILSVFLNGTNVIKYYEISPETLIADLP